MKIVFVLGMHRSGTSCLAKCLESMGLNFILDQVGPTAYAKHLEYGEVVRPNDQILRGWKEPVLDRNVLFKKFYELKVKSFLKKSHKGDSWVGIKDPRILLTFPYWISATSKYKAVGIFRRPLEVAESFSQRQKGYGYADEGQSLELWRISNINLLNMHQKYGVPILNFNDTKTNFSSKLKVVCEEKKLPFSLSSLMKCFEKVISIIIWKKFHVICKQYTTNCCLHRAS